MPVVEDLARFVSRRSWSDLSASAREALKVRVLDSLGCALGAFDDHLSKLSAHSSESSAAARSAP